MWWCPVNRMRLVALSPWKNFCQRRGCRSCCMPRSRMSLSWARSAGPVSFRLAELLASRWIETEALSPFWTSGRVVCRETSPFGEQSFMLRLPEAMTSTENMQTIYIPRYVCDSTQLPFPSHSPKLVWSLIQPLQGGISSRPLNARLTP